MLAYVTVYVDYIEFENAKKGEAFEGVNELNNNLESNGRIEMKVPISAIKEIISVYNMAGSPETIYVLPKDQW